MDLIDSEDSLHSKYLTLFQLKDFVGSDARKNNECVMGITSRSYSITVDLVNEAMNRRYKHMFFKDAKLYQCGGASVEKEIDNIRNALLTS